MLVKFAKSGIYKIQGEDGIFQVENDGDIIDVSELTAKVYSYCCTPVTKDVRPDDDTRVKSEGNPAISRFKKTLGKKKKTGKKG